MVVPHPRVDRYSAFIKLVTDLRNAFTAIHNATIELGGVRPFEETRPLEEAALERGRPWRGES